MGGYYGDMDLPVADEDTWLAPSDYLAIAVENVAARYVIGADCESPIEVDFGSHLLMSSPPLCKVEPQYKWRRYRMDFAILLNGNPIAFVECDGAAYHSTPEQIDNDRKKDAAAAEAGIRMFRFTGSQIYREASACAQKVWAELGI